MFKSGTKVRVVNYEHDELDGPNPNGKEGVVLSPSLFPSGAMLNMVLLDDCPCLGFTNWIFEDNELEAVNVN